MNEIELKFKIDDYNKIYQKLLQMGCIFEKTIEQKDAVFFHKDNENYDINFQTIVIRTRIIDNVIKQITLKSRMSEIYACKEIEFSVENSEKIDEFIYVLGFVKTIEFTKKRTQTTFGEFNICFDEIDKLGKYIEIEIITKDNDIQLYKNKILDFANFIGINTNDIESRYYPQMILSQQKRRSESL